MAIIKNFRNILLFSFRRLAAKILLSGFCGCIIFAVNSYAVETPTGIYFDEVSSNSITASGYVSTGFTGLETGLAGVNVAINGTYSTWRNGNKWTTKAAMPTARYGLAAGVIGGKLYVVGGSVSGGMGNTNEEYDPASNTWATKAVMPTARVYLSAGVIGGKLYAVGGNNGNLLNTNEEYDPASNTWATKAGMPTARETLSVGAIGGKLYALGGAGGSSPNTEEYDPVSNTWSTKAPIPTTRAGLAAGVISGKLYAVGGNNGGYLNTNEEYDPASNTWSTKAVMSTARYNLSVAVIGGKLYAMGGANPGFLNNNEEYDPWANTWSTKAVMPTAREYFSVGVVGGKLSAVGGLNGDLNTNEEYDPGVEALFTGLTPNTQYSFNAKARDAAGVETAESPTVSTYTLAAIPGAAVQAFTSVYASSLTVQWTLSNNPAGTTLYRAQASTDSAFGLVAASSDTYNINAILTGLSGNTTYYTRVAAINGNGIITAYKTLGSTRTLVETPTGIYFDEVSSTSITASGYAATPAFSGLETGLSGVNVAKDGIYSTWRNGNKWTTKAAMPTARNVFSAGIIGGKLYAVGGSNGGYLNINEEYDPVANTWATKAVMPTPRQMLSVGVIGGKLYAVGGANGSNLNVNEEYDPTANTWATKAVMPTARNGLSVGVIGGKLYAVGGLNGIYLNTNEEYDPAANTWMIKAIMPTARQMLSAGVIGGKLYAVGGEISPANVVNTNEEYDPAANTWATKAIMPTARQRLSVGVIGGKLYIVGGDNNSGVLNINEEYDPIANTWATKAVMPTTRQHLSSGIIGGKLYAVGGENGGYLNTNEEYDPGVASSFTGLAPNTQYSFKAKARDAAGVETVESPTVSTYTLAAVAMPASGQPFVAVYVSSITVNWSSGTAAGGFNGTGASYKIQISTASDFSGVSSSSVTYSLQLTTSGLSSGITYYFRAQTYNTLGVTDYSWLVLGSTKTLTSSSGMTAPTGIYFDEVSSNSITASGYVSTGFTGLETGLSGVNVAKDGIYSTWRNGNKWTTKAVMPTDRRDLAAGVIGGKLYVVGGQGGANNANEEYDPASNTWATKASMPTPRLGLSAGVIGGKLYMVGGHPALSTNEEYDPTANSWTTKAGMPTARGLVSAGVIDGRLYVIGGYSLGSMLDTNEEYDPASNTWATKASMPTARYQLSAGVIGGKLYATGGTINGSSSYLSANEEYNPVSNTWTTKAVMPTARYGLSSGVIGGKLYAVGGYTVNLLDTNEEYDPVANTWAAKAVMPTARYTLSAGVIGGKLYAVGGQGPNEEYNPGVALSFTGLTPNTQYSFKAKARDASGVETAESPTVSTYTLAAVPIAATPAFTGVNLNAITVNWTQNNNPVGTTLYRAQASVDSAFGTVAASSDTYNLSAVLPGLSANTVYYARVAAINGNGIITTYTVFGSTKTLTSSSAMTTPTGIYFDEVSSNSITASGYVSTGFTGLETGLSGVNVAKDGIYSTWRNGNVWVAKAVMPTARDWLAVGVISGKLYAVGGEINSGNTILNTNEEYDPVSNTWATKAVMPTARGYLSAGVIGGKLYAVGGYYNAEYKNTNEAYDPAANTWITKAAMPTARNALSVGVIGGKLYAVGGWNVSHLNINEEYDPAFNTWATKATMLTDRYALSVGVIGGKLYAVGGYGSSYLNTNEEYDPGVASSFTGLSPNTQYSFTAKARDASGVETAESPTVSTYTLAAVPITATPAFTGVNLNAITVNWTQNNNPVGTTLYRAQASVNSAFGTVAASSDTYNLSAVLPGLSANTVYYACVAAINGNGIITAYTALGSTTTVAAGNSVPTLAWTGESNYIADGLNPESGDTATSFAYHVKYTDADNDAPGSGYPKVHIKKGGTEISGSPFTMTFVSGAYNTGAIYNYSKTLAVGTDYTYYFEALDSIGATATGTPTSSVDAPDVSLGNSPPTLAWTNERDYTADGLNPETGDTLTSFVYRVKYTDADNDAPLSGYPKVHIEKSGTDISGSPFTMTFVSGAYNTGAIYTYLKTLAAVGTDYTYYFEAQDIHSNMASGSPLNSVDSPDVAEVVQQHGNYKTTMGDNLFNPKTGGTSKVKFNVPAAGRVSLKIYDLSGKLIRTLFEGDSNSGNIQKDWDGRDDSGRYVVPSVYFLHYVHPGGKEVRKIGVKK
ncbi:MAG: hypothetical protein NTX59_05405 [Elusimicrobia bacterium]|nr:hypothetical protein [Elusimicrobiota bacterium]